MIDLLWIPLAILLLGGVVWAAITSGRKKKRLPAAASARLRTQWKKASSANDPHLLVLNCEKVLDQALRELGYRGTFAEKLKQAGPRIKNEQAVWSAHRLRNRIAHESDVHVTERQGKRASQAFYGALKDICTKF